MTLPLSIAIVTLNEEENLPRLLESARGLAAEIVVVDSGSTDATEAIARSAGAKFLRAKWEGFITQKNRALDACTQPWVLFLDADEALSPELAASLEALFAEGQAPAAEGYWINRRTWYLGAWIWHAWYPEWRLRLVKRGACRWGGMDPHAALDFKGGAARLQGDLLHYSFRDLEDHLRRTVGYARTMARSYAGRGRPFRWRCLVFSPFWAFFKHLALKGGWRDGWRGWVISAVRMFDCFAKYAFLLEHEQAEAVREREPQGPQTAEGVALAMGSALRLAPAQRVEVTSAGISSSPAGSSPARRQSSRA